MQVELPIPNLFEFKVWNDADSLETKAAILDLANKSLDQIETLINDMEAKILAILKPYDVGPEIATAPVYERLMRRWALM
jgi:hypothetical protein